MRALTAVTNSGFLRLVALAGAAGWLVAFPTALACQSGLFSAPGQPFGGDFASFYTAGRLVLEGRGSELYDLHTQQATQARLLRAPGYAGLLAYANPPTLALVFAPLAALPYKLAYAVCTLGLLAAFLASMKLLRPHLGGLAEQWGTVVGLVWLFYPISKTVTAGQNIVIALLLLVIIFDGLSRARSVRAGLALGLLIYKPQLALVVGLLLLFGRQFRCVGTAAAVGLGHYLIGAVICGPWWPGDMLAMLTRYCALENMYNGSFSISLVGFCEYWGPPESGRWIGWVAAAMLLAAVAWSWWRADARPGEFRLCWGMTVCAAILVSPHAQWYETGLTVLPVLLALNHYREQGWLVTTGVRAALLLGFLLVPVYEPASRLGFQPLILIPLAVVIWLNGLSRARAASSAAAAPAYSSRN